MLPDLPLALMSFLSFLLTFNTLSSLFLDYFLNLKFSLMLADTILKKYSSTVATIFTGIASAALFGHTLTTNFILGISIVFISMHQVISV